MSFAPDKPNVVIQDGRIHSAGPTPYPAELPPRPEQSRQDRRMCPGYRSCVPGLTWSSYSLKTNGDKALLYRRLGMILILVLRTAVPILYAIFGDLAYLILNVILGVVMFVFVAHWLHLIGSMTGTRRVMGMSAGRRTFDTFLVIMVLLHAGIIVGTFFTTRWIMDVVWVILGLAIFGGAWITIWDPEPSAMNTV